jgi:release factor glutamine methyltransferase
VDAIHSANLETLPPESVALYRECESALIAGLRTLPDKPEETVAATLAALWHAAAGQPCSAQRALATALPPLEPNVARALRTMLQQRIDGTPLAHLTGRQQFMDMELLASTDALIPRKETELLGRVALERLLALVAERGAAKVIDVCTGSGNLALALAWHEPRARVWGADLSEEAVALARRNAAHVGLAERVVFAVGDLLAPFETPELLGSVDLVVCNPPYLSSGKVDVLPDEIIGHEPRLAFDGGPLGIRILQRLIKEAPRFLRPGGWLAFEVGLGQGRGIRGRLEQHGGYAELREALDAQGQVRALCARMGAP